MTKYNNILLSSKKYKAQKNYWINELSALEVEQILPTNIMNRRRKILPYEEEVSELEFTLPVDISTALLKLSKNTDISLYVILLSAFITFLYKYTGREDVLLGIPVLYDDDMEHSYNDVLVLRKIVSGDMMFKEILIEVREKFVNLCENQDYPFEKILEAPDLMYKNSYDLLFDLIFASENIHKINSINSKKGNLFISFIRNGIGIDFRFRFNPGVYSEYEVSNFIKYFNRLLECMIDDLSQRLSEMDILSEEEKRQILIDFNQTSWEYPGEHTINELFEMQAVKTPGKTAVSFVSSETHTNTFLSYNKLDKKANQLANILRKNGINPGKFAALMVDRSLEMITGIMAILKAGRAYIPIAPDNPPVRSNFILQDCEAQFLLVQKSIVEFYGDVFHSPFLQEIVYIDESESFPAKNANPEPVNNPGNLAYVMYTSGTTGNPKGTLITHRNVINLVYGLNEKIYKNYKKDLAVALIAPYVFDASVQQIFAALLLGHTLCIVPEVNRFSGELLIDFFKTNAIDISDGTPLHIKLLNENTERNIRDLSMKHLLIGGEALPYDVVKDFFEKFDCQAPKITNVYGPTECCVDSVFYEISQESLANLNRIPIGKPMPNVQIYILNQKLKLQPIGIAGELCISGEGVGQGYLKKTELTKEKFIENPYVKGARLYRTGDSARWLADGNIEFLGRLDKQVKIRGFRIECEEIEACLLQMDDLKDAVVIDREGKEGMKYLCAYIVSDEEINGAELRNHLLKRLPSYMIPSYFIQLYKIPVTPNGKLDRNALPLPESGTAHEEYVAPRDELEHILAEVWAEILGIEKNKIGINDNFFMLGGDSIKAIQISARLPKHRLKLEINEIFLHPTIKQLKNLTKKTVRSIDQEIVEGEVALTPIQKWFFENHFTRMNHFNHAVMLEKEDGFDRNILENLFTKIVGHHDALRMVFEMKGNQIVQKNRGIEEGKLFDLETINLYDRTDAVSLEIETKANHIQRSINLEKGPLLKLGLFKTLKADYLLVVIHHLVVDGVSWRILLEDLESGYKQLQSGEEVKLPEKTDSYKYWATKLVEYSESQVLLNELEFWKTLEETEIHRLTKDNEVTKEEKKFINNETLYIELDEKQTNRLLKEVNRAYNSEINDLLMTALGEAVKKWQGIGKLLVHLEGHGREPIGKDINSNRTVGWITTQYPVVLDMTQSEDLSYNIKLVKETLRKIPNKGIGYGILKYLTPDEKKKSLKFKLKPEIQFNYHGQVGNEGPSGYMTFKFSNIKTGELISPHNEADESVDINGIVVDGKLNIAFSYNKLEFKKDNIQTLAEHYKECLINIIKHCMTKEKEELTPSDVGYNKLSISELESIQSFVKGI